MARIMVQLERKRREIPWLLLFIAGLFFVTFVFNSVTWSALSRVEGVGSRLEYHAGVGAPLAWTYLKLGRAATSALGMEKLQVDAVTQAYARTLPAIAEAPEKAVDLVLEERGSTHAATLRYSHYASPVLFLLWILLTVLRPGRLNTFNARR